MQGLLISNAFVPSNVPKWQINNFFLAISDALTFLMPLWDNQQGIQLTPKVEDKIRQSRSFWHHPKGFKTFQFNFIFPRRGRQIPNNCDLGSFDDSILDVFQTLRSIVLPISWRHASIIIGCSCIDLRIMHVPLFLPVSKHIATLFASPLFK